MPLRLVNERARTLGGGHPQGVPLPDSGSLRWVCPYLMQLPCAEEVLAGRTMVLAAAGRYKARAPEVMTSGALVPSESRLV